MTVYKNSYSKLPDGARGRGTALRPDGRYLLHQRSPCADEDFAPDAAADHGVETRLFVDQARSVITRNQSPDIPFDRSINPYRGCEHGCAYCFARPSHARLDLSPGIDFETQLSWKPEAAALLRRELAAPGYRCAPIALGVNTDAWQPVERRTQLSRQLLEVLLETRHPVSIITKSALIERDLDLLAALAERGLVNVMMSITTLDDELARRLEPRAPRPARRLQTLQRLHAAGVPVGVLFAPLIPALNDHELEAVVEAAHVAGARSAGYVLLRLPHELKELFTDWLNRHAPGRQRHVLSLLADLRGGRSNDPRFGHRMRGNGVLAELYHQRMRLLQSRLGLQPRLAALDCSQFRPPARAARRSARTPVQPGGVDAQLKLF